MPTDLRASLCVSRVTPAFVYFTPFLMNTQVEMGHMENSRNAMPTTSSNENLTRPLDLFVATPDDLEPEGSQKLQNWHVELYKRFV